MSRMRKEEPRMAKKEERMNEIIEFADHYYARYNRSPTCRAIAAGTTLERSSVHRYLVAMDQMGKIEYNGQTIVTPKIREMQSGLRKIGIVGSIACGVPVDGGDSLDEYMSLPYEMVGDDEMYILYAEGKSMIEAGIDEGDLVLVQRQETATPGEIVVAYVEGEGNTLKRLKMDGKTIVLHPENAEMEDIRVKECRVQGVARWVFKKLDS